MDFSVDSLDLEKIDSTQNLYRITTPQGKPSIHQSINRLGLICPVVVKQTRDHYIVVSGFRRIDACRRNAWQSIPCRILPETISAITCAEIAIADNLTQRSLNFVEQARCLGLLIEATGDFNSAQAVAQTMQLGFNSNLVSKLKTILNAPEILQTGIILGTLSLPVAITLAELAKEDAIALAQLFEKLPMGLNKQREVLQNVKEIAIREDMTIRDVLEDDVLRDILFDEASDGNQKAYQIRFYLKKRRFPRIVETEEAFKACVKGLGLGTEIQVTPPPGFEGSTCTMTIRFNNLESLKHAHQKISKAITNPSVTNLFN
jgi:hypothetical protein